MSTLAQDTLIPILIVLLIGIVVGWWVFRGGRAAPTTAEQREPAPETVAPEPAPKAVAAEPAPKTAIPEPTPKATAPKPPAPEPAREGKAIADQAAAATADVAGEILGVDAHPDISGAGGTPDDLQLLKGVGPKMAGQLNALGITRFDQLAGFSANEIAIIDEKLGAFRGRLARDRVVEQAGYLARNDRDGFEAKFGKLG